MPHRLTRAVLQVPLFYKVVLANVAILLAAVALTAWLMRAYLPVEDEVPEPLVWLAFGGAVLVVSVLANVAVVRLALTPLDDLETTARAIAGGDLSRRSSVSPLADRDLERIIRAFNEMLDRLDMYRARLRELSARSLEAQEQERRRIARELHDDTAQRLAAVALRLSLLQKKGRATEWTGELDELRAEVVETLEALRGFARGLRPPALDELGLVTAVEAHAREVQEQFGLPVEVERPPEEPSLSPEGELVAYRIVQEAVTNARRHADAGTVRVSFHVAGDVLEIVVEDDGRGFVPEEAIGEGKSLGLFGMRERASYVDGRLDIESEPGQGTRITLRLPVAS